MIDNALLINQLEDFKNTQRYNSEQFIDFLYGNSVLRNICKVHVEKFLYYLKTQPNLIEKYSNDYRDILHLNYTAEEMKIVNDIQKCHLDTFWVYDLEKNGFNLSQAPNGKEMRFAVKVFDDKHQIDLVDYIIKFCIVSEKSAQINNNEKQNLEKMHILKYFDETNNFTLDAKEFRLTIQETEVLKEICSYSKEKDFIQARDVSRINAKAKEIINQSLISRKITGKPYRLAPNISYRD